MYELSDSHLPELRFKIDTIRTILNTFVLERIQKREQSSHAGWNKVVSFLGLVTVSHLKKSALPGDILMGKILFNDDEHFLIQSARRLQEMYNNVILYGTIPLSGDDQMLLEKLDSTFFQNIYNKIMQLETGHSSCDGFATK